MIETMNYSVLVNFFPWGNFDVERGLRQGDPIFSYLFIMVVEVLGRAFLRKVNMGDIKGIKSATSLVVEVIQKKFDDTFLSGDSSVFEAKAWKHILEIYMVNVGKKINLDKIKVFFFNMKHDIQRRVLNNVGCNMAFLPDTYLGLPLTIKEVSNKF